MPGKRNFSSYSQQQEQINVSMQTSSIYRSSNKKLRRLPHVFSKVLELPFKSDKDVYVEDSLNCLKFTASTTTDSRNGVMRGGIHVVEVHPGITKVVVRKSGSPTQLCIDELELDVWRFRLPASARPELATVVYEVGQLVVTVPKNGLREQNGKGGDCKGGIRGNMGNIVVVQ